MMRFWACLLAWLCLAGTAAAADVKPQVNYGGQLQPIKPGDTLGVANGGTSSTSLTAHCVLVGAGTSPPHTICPVLIGDMLTDNGPGVDPSYQPAGNPLCLGTSLACIYMGVGVPTRTDLGTGSISCDVTSGQCYSYFGPQTPPTRVQEKSADNTLTVVMTNVPTVGNSLWAFCTGSGSSAISLNATYTALSGFSQSAFNGANGSGIIGVRKVQAGDTATQTPCTGGSGRLDVNIIEVSGTSSTPLVNVQSVVSNTNNNGGVTLNATTMTSNTLAVSSGSGWGCCINGFPLTWSGSTWGNKTVAGSGTVGTGLATIPFTLSGSGVTAITALTAQTSTPNPEVAFLMILQPNAPLTTGWQSINYLQVQANSVAVDLFPRALNFGAGLSVSASGGIDTITATGSVTVTGSPASGNMTKFSGAASITNGDLSGDCTTSGTFVVTCLKTNGSAFGTFATANAATPPAIGGTTPAAGSFTTLSATGNLTTNVTGSTQCVQVNSSGVVSGTGSACGSASGAAIHGTPTSGNCTSWFNSTTVQDAGAPCGGGGGSSTIVPPQGRLTLVTGAPVMSSDQTAKSTVYYDCYAGSSVPYYTGSVDALDTISACEVSMTMQTSSTGVTNNAGVFDVWWVHSGASRICVATNGSGGGWASDTGGSNTARGTGYSQVHNTRGYWTNVNSIAHCYNGSTDYGSVSADQATYLGTLYTTAAGQTGVAFTPAAASGGGNPIIGLFNAYNRVRVSARSMDSTSSWTYSTNAWRPTNNSTSNRISNVDGLGQISVVGFARILGAASGGSDFWQIGINRDSTSATPTIQSQAGGAANVQFNPVANDVFPPAIGFHFYQGMENNSTVSGTLTFFAGSTYQAVIIEAEM